MLWECDASSHRFHLLNINALKRMYAIFPYRFYQNWELSPQAASMDENHYSVSYGLPNPERWRMNVVSPWPQ